MLIRGEGTTRRRGGLMGARGIEFLALDRMGVSWVGNRVGESFKPVYDKKKRGGHSDQ